MNANERKWPRGQALSAGRADCLAAARWSRWWHRLTCEGGFRTIGLACALLLAAGPAAALRCPRGIVSEGDPSILLLRNCGEPALRERFEEQRAVYRYDRWGDRLPGVIDYEIIPVEIWSYNFGPSRLLMRVQLRDGRILRIESDGYGW